MLNSISSKSQTGKGSKSSTEEDEKKSKKMRCPNCNKEIPVERHPSKKGFLVAYHDCTKRGRVPVYEAPIKTFKK